MIPKAGFRVVRFGVFFSLLTLLMGFLMGMIFGIAEDNLKADLKDRAASVEVSIYNGDAEKAAAVVSKAWTYFKRAHMHAGALGTSALVVCVLVAIWGVRPTLFFWLTTAMGIGAFGYSIFWWLAGLRAPLLGSTAAAKESLAFLAMPSAGLLLLSVMVVIGLWVNDFLISKKHS